MYRNLTYKYFINSLELLYFIHSQELKNLHPHFFPLSNTHDHPVGPPLYIVCQHFQPLSPIIRPSLHL